MTKNVIHTDMENFYAVQKESEALQRFKWFSGKIDRDGKEAYIREDDEWFVYAEEKYKVKFGKKLFKLQAGIKGFSYNKKTKILKVWLGTALNALQYRASLYAHLKVEWVTKHSINDYMTKGLLLRIIQQKITNPTDACKYIIKACRFPKDTSPKFLLKYLSGNDQDRKHLFTAAYVAKNLNHWLNPISHECIVIASRDTNLLYDTIKQAQILNKKIDFTWSTKRLQEEHEDWTNEIMLLEIGNIGAYKIEYKNVPELPAEFEIITDQQRLFKEGTVMSHCIYTNYYEEWKIGKYLVIHLKGEDQKGKEENVTIGLIYNNKTKHIKIDEALCKRNAEPSEFTQIYIEDVLSNKKTAIALGKMLQEYHNRMPKSKTKRMMQEYRYELAE